MRLSCVEWVEGGVSLEDTIETARQLKALAATSSMPARRNSPARRSHRPGYHVDFSARIRKEAGIKTWAVGIITEPDQASASSPRARRLHGACPRFLLDPRWAGTPRAPWCETPPLPLPAIRATTIRRSSLSPPWPELPNSGG